MLRRDTEGLIELQQHREVPNTLDYRTLFPADSFKDITNCPHSRTSDHRQ